MPVSVAGITEIAEGDAERVDGVKNPANGFPFLMIKAVGEPTDQDGCGCCKGCAENCDGKCCDDCGSPMPAGKAVNAQGGIDEKPDIAGAQRVMVELFKLVAAEAAEGATGAFHEVHDIGMLVDAICSMQCFLWAEQDGDEDDGEPIAKSAEVESVESFVNYALKRKVSAARRKELASEGNALADGSYPIENEGDLHNAAILARSGHGDVAAAKRLIAKRAKELGVANPLAHDATKDGAVEEPQAVKGGDDKDTEKDDSIVGDKTKTTPADEAVKGIDAQLEEAVAKAASLEAANAELRDELAKVKATPIPGGPKVTAPASARKETERSDLLSKAAHFDRMADQITEQDMKTHYRTQAQAAREAANGLV